MNVRTSHSYSGDYGRTTRFFTATSKNGTRTTYVQRIRAVTKLLPRGVSLRRRGTPVCCHSLQPVWRLCSSSACDQQTLTTKAAIDMTSQACDQQTLTTKAAIDMTSQACDRQTLTAKTAADMSSLLIRHWTCSQSTKTTENVPESIRTSN